MVFSKSMLRNLLLVAGFGISSALQAQLSLSVDNANNLVQQVLVGAGVQVSNITSQGDPAQIGRFSNGNSVNLGISNGVIMTVGNLNSMADQADLNYIGSAADAWTSSSSGDNTTNISNDPDLNAILTQFGVTGGFPGLSNNVAVIEFDFVPAGDSLKFNYVFGSEEYQSYVCSDFFDAFGFFLSGPGINGPYSNNSINLALVPGTSLPVGINTLNDGVSDGGVCPVGGLDNSAYYVDNSNGTNFGIIGYTVPLTCEAQVQCGETYHIKLVIANGSDTSLDSWVFLEAESFSSAIPDLNIANLLPDSAVIEGCLDGELVFTRNITTESLSIPVIYGGSAINGVDYTGMPDTLNFPVGVDSLFFTLVPINDGISETGGLENIIIGFRVVNDCGDTVDVEKTIKIKDPYELTLVSQDPVLNCPTNSQTLGVQVSGGYAPYQFTWLDPAAITPTINVPITESQSFIVQITDSLDCEWVRTADTIQVTLNYDSMQVITNNYEICSGFTIPIFPLVAGGFGDYTFNWNGAGVGDTIQVTATDTTLYPFTVTDECNIAVNDTIVVNVPNYLPITVVTSDTTICSKDGLAILWSEPSGGNGVYTYEWDGPGTITQFNDSMFNAAPPTTSQYMVMITDGCGSMGYDTMTVEVINCELEVGNAFSPNGDGKNDYFTVNFIEQYPGNTVFLFNRWGKKVFEANNYKNDWAGTDELISGTYYYIVDPGDGSEFLKGWVAVFRE